MALPKFWQLSRGKSAGQTTWASQLALFPKDARFSVPHIDPTGAALHRAGLLLMACLLQLSPNMADLLLHSLKEFREILLDLLQRVEPKSILEIGSETGVFSDELQRYCSRTKARLTTVDPKPAQHLLERAKKDPQFQLVADLSLNYLKSQGTDCDFAIIDGDHNYHTVYHELSLIHQSWEDRGMAGTIILHDVGFPCARRDFYYDPGSIPEDARHPFSFDQGVTLDNPGLIAGGFRGMGNFAWALREGGPRNGVLTAIEDFRTAHPEYRFRSIDAVFGLGALSRQDSAQDAAVEAVFAPFGAELIRRLERNRLELYLRVIQLQDELAAHAMRNR